MSKPRKQDRPAWLKERERQAADAAVNGHGWVHLSNLWECSTAAALQWSRDNIDPDVCRLIGLNGMARRYPNTGRKYVREDRMKPAMHPARQSNGRVHYLTCQHVLYIAGKVETCGADTLNGSHACPKCKQREAKTEGFQLRDLRLVQY